MEASLSSARNLAARTVHIKIHPTAKTLSERREVLRVLERFGEVSMFRSLKHHPKTPTPNAFLSIFTSESAAADIINASPIRYRLIPDPPPSADPIPVGPPIPAPLEQPPATAPEKTFELHLSRSSFDHAKYIASPITNPLYGPFRPVPPKHSFIGAALERVVPSSLWAPGLRDWETDGLRRRNGGGVGFEGEEGGSNLNVLRIVQERERRRREKAIPKVMKGLRALRGEGQEWDER